MMLVSLGCRAAVQPCSRAAVQLCSWGLSMGKERIVLRDDPVLPLCFGQGDAICAQCAAVVAA